MFAFLGNNSPVYEVFLSLPISSFLCKSYHFLLFKVSLPSPNNNCDLHLQFLHYLHKKATIIQPLQVFRCVKTFLFYRQQQSRLPNAEVNWHIDIFNKFLQPSFILSVLLHFNSSDRKMRVKITMTMPKIWLCCTGTLTCIELQQSWSCCPSCSHLEMYSQKPFHLKMPPTRLWTELHITKSFMHCSYYIHLSFISVF